MAIKVTRWRPDTCECIIEYEWDDTSPLEERIHTHKSIIKCEHHATIDDNIEAHEKVKNENSSKNKVLGHILENFPEVVEEVTDKDGVITKELKGGIKYEWSFDENRELVAGLTGVTAKINTDIKASLDAIPDGVKLKLK